MQRVIAMDFNSWQIDKLRRGLHAYRAMRTRAGRLPSWSNVLDDIYYSNATELVYPKTEDEPLLKQEALRRFANGASVLKPDMLHEVWQFLLSVRILKEGELAQQQELLNEAVTVHSCLADVSERTMGHLLELAPVLKVVGNTLSEEDIELRLAIVPSGTLLLVEERERVGVEHLLQDPLERRDAYSTNQLRRGYGIVLNHLTMLDPTMLNLFVRGGDKSDSVHYARVVPESRIEGVEEGMYFVRRGGLHSPICTGDAVEKMLRCFGIVRFVPAVAQD